MKNVLVVMVMVGVAGMASAAFTENFNAFVAGPLTAQQDWEGDSRFDVVTDGFGGMALKSNTYTDKTTRHDAAGVDFALTMDQDGIEYGFDVKEDVTTLFNMRMYLRKQHTATYAPSFGFLNGTIVIRPAGEFGDLNVGNAFYSEAIYGAGTEEDPGYWLKGDWLRVEMTLTGDAFDTATVKAYNLSRGGLKIPTGLKNVTLGVNPKDHAGWTGFNFRGGTTGTTIDNAFVTDYTRTVAEVLSPEEGEVSVATSDVVLEWVSGSSIDSHQVYFGTDADALDFKIDTTSTSYLLQTLDYWTDYYWRINEVIDGNVVTTGDVWSFKTMVEPVELPRFLAYEGFDYVADSDLTAGDNGTGGFGWATGWEREIGTHCYVEVGFESLDPGMDYPYGMTGNRIQHFSDPEHTNDAMRKLEYPIDLRVDQDYYISYLQMGTNDDNAFDAGNKVNFRVLEGKSGGSSFGVDMFYVGYDPLVTTPMVYIRDFDGGWHTNPVGGWSSGVTSVVVVKIEAHAAGNDILSVCVYDVANPMPMEEPATWQRSVSADKNTLYEWIQFKGRGDHFDRWNVDEIHVGTGWGAVTGWVEACGDLGTIMDWDLNADCTIDLGDFAVIAGQWLSCTDPAGTGCVWALDADDPSVTTLFTDLDALERNVYEVRSPVIVNGDLSEWDGVRWYNTRFTGGYETGFAADVIEAQMALTWDPTTPEVVYVAVKVTDTDLYLTDSPTAWDSGDNLEVGFSVNMTSIDEQWFDDQTYDNAQYYQMFSKASGGTWCTLGSISHATDDPATDDIDVAYATSVEGAVIIYEMALPTYSAFNLGTGTGTKLTLIHGDIIAFNLQINSAHPAGAGGLYETQSHAPIDWFDFTVTENSSLVLGDMGFFDADLDTNGEVGLTDLQMIALMWLSCTDPEIEGCDTPWAP